MDKNDSPVMTPREVCELLKISARTLRNWEVAGIVTGRRYTGRIVRYSRAEIERLAMTGRTDEEINATPIGARGKE